MYVCKVENKIVFSEQKLNNSCISVPDDTPPERCELRNGKVVLLNDSEWERKRKERIRKQIVDAIQKLYSEYAILQIQMGLRSTQFHTEYCIACGERALTLLYHLKWL